MRCHLLTTHTSYQNVSWVCVCVQVNEATADLLEDCASGRRSELSAALLDVMQRYMGQFRLLSEIQGLRSRWVSTSCCSS